ncbi:MAG: plastocyanin/azurin family copper-binding protein, partial [Planctomycetota bacterium]|nr:plastocyanin/azurin family copper-binding protein [Planctomycetota bacterium]
EGRPLSKPVAVAGLERPDLLKLLEHPINGVRHRVRSELSGRETTAVIAATEKWLESFDIRKPEDAHHLLEGLWVYQQHNVLNRDLLKKLLNSPEAHARLAAQRVQYMWDHNKSAPGPAPVDEQVNAAPTPPEGAIVLRTVIEKMKYDVESFTVAAGSPVKLWFYNPDYMPHNLVIGQPGSAESIGPAAEAMGADGFNKAFVPEHDQVLVASKLLMHKEAELIEFTAPTKPGKYDFLCTFPGHWKLMRGTMIVE